MLRITYNVNARKPVLSSWTIHKEYPKGILLIANVLLFALASSLLLSIYDLNAQAQKSGSSSNPDQVFRVNVQVFNSANTDEVGTIHVFVDNTNVSRVLNGAVFPAESTVFQIFEFNSTDVPVGKGFTAEIVYGDDKFKSNNGVNSPSKEPEIIQLTIP